MKKGDILTVEIKDIAFGGKGIVRYENFVIFVPSGLAGQKLEIKITQIKRRYADAIVMRILEHSKLEDSKLIEKFQLTSGAPWICLPLEVQIDFKKKQIFDLFKKFADFDLEPVFEEIIAAPQPFFYRNKMEFSFGYDEDKFVLGSKKKGQFDQVENLDKLSGIFDEEFESFLPEIREFCKKTNLLPWNPNGNEGFFRKLIVRKSFFQNCFLINLVTDSRNTEKFKIAEFVKFLNTKFSSQIAGIYWTQLKSKTDDVQNFINRKLVFGKEKITEKINDLEFEISIDSFFQPNIFSAESLYKKCIQYADVKLNDSVLDLFCGTGTIAQVLAKNYPSSQIQGVEISASAVQDAKKNAELNGLKNVDFICEDVNKFLKTFTNPDLATVVLDPPRAGLSPKSCDKILVLSPKKIIYISCNPATAARDIAILNEKYELKKLTIVDQFPHTSHIEVIMKLERK
jgi:23S rRNA (uracil-5-)-methyltransferase RumA